MKNNIIDITQHKAAKLRKLYRALTEKALKRRMRIQTMKLFEAYYTIGDIKMKVIINNFKIINDLSELEDLFSNEDIESICTSGPNDEAVKQFREGHDIELSDYVLDQCQEYGAHENFKALSHKDQLDFAIWAAAWNRFDRDIEE